MKCYTTIDVSTDHRLFVMVVFERPYQDGTEPVVSTTWEILQPHATPNAVILDLLSSIRRDTLECVTLTEHELFCCQHAAAQFLESRWDGIIVESRSDKEDAHAV